MEEEGLIERSEFARQDARSHLRLIVGLLAVLVLVLLGTSVVLAVLYATKDTTNFLGSPTDATSQYASTLQQVTDMFRENRQNVLNQYFKNAAANSVILMQGNSLVTRNYDVTYPFRQDSNFNYMSGVWQPDAWLVYDTSTNFCTVYLPTPTPTYGIWYGRLIPPSVLAQQWQVDAVQYYPDLSTYFSARVGQIPTVYVMNATLASTWTSVIPNITQFTLDGALLSKALSNCRAIKSPKEIIAMQFAATISSNAHGMAMKQTQNGIYEFQLQSYFEGLCLFNGLFFQAYDPIIGSGYNSAVLHYSANDDQITDGEIILLDAGAEFLGYGTDITRTFPANGVYSVNQTMIYALVLNIQQTIINMLAPGVLYASLSNRCNQMIVQGLLDLGFLKGNVTALMDAKMYRVFMPHGLGHSVGQDVHDPWNSTIPLASGMVITIEPGIYFNEESLNIAANDAVQGPFLVPSMVAGFTNFGGVRIEDTVLITESGSRSLSTAPKTIGDVEHVVGQLA